MPIHAVLEGLLARGVRENAALLASVADAPAVQAATKALHNGDPEAFQFALGRPLESLIDGLLQHEFPGAHRVHFLCKHADFIERHVRWLVARHEGAACSADKSRTILRALFHALVSNKDIEWDYTQQYTYHLPKRVLTTHDAVMSLFDGLHALYFGNPAPYLDALTTALRETQEPTGPSEPRPTAANEVAHG